MNGNSTALVIKVVVTTCWVRVAGSGARAEKCRIAFCAIGERRRRAGRVMVAVIVL